MNHETGAQGSATPQELREQVEETRERLGMTVEELAGKADVRARAQEKAADVKAQVREKAGHAKAQLNESRTRALRLVEDRAPDHLRERIERAGANPAAPFVVVGGLWAAIFLLKTMAHRHQARRIADRRNRAGGWRR